LKYRLVGDERSGHAQHAFLPCLQNGEGPTAIAHISFRSEPDDGRLGKQGGGTCLL
jgi:hypothetical protein